MGDPGREAERVNPWQSVSQVSSVLTAFVQGAGLLAGLYYIEKVSAEHKEELEAEPPDEEVLKIDESKAARKELYAHVTEWSRLPGAVKLLLSFSTVIITVSYWAILVAPSFLPPETMIKKYILTDCISVKLNGKFWTVVTTTGWFFLALFGLSCVLLWIFGKWASSAMAANGVNMFTTPAAAARKGSKVFDDADVEEGGGAVGGGGLMSGAAPRPGGAAAATSRMNLDSAGSHSSSEAEADATGAKAAAPRVPSGAAAVARVSGGSGSSGAGKQIFSQRSPSPRKVDRGGGGAPRGSAAAGGSSAGAGAFLSRFADEKVADKDRNFKIDFQKKLPGMTVTQLRDLRAAWNDRRSAGYSAATHAEVMRLIDAEMAKRDSEVVTEATAVLSQSDS